MKNQISFYSYILVFAFLISSIVACSSHKTADQDDLEVKDGITYLKSSGKPFTGTKISHFDDGTKSSEVNYKKGLMDGKFETFHLNGNLASTGTYKGSKLDGKFESYNEQGVLIYSSENKEGKQNGVYQVFNENGKLMEYKEFKDGVLDGKLKSFHTNGKQKTLVSYTDGKPNGPAQKWDENGNLQVNWAFDQGVNVSLTGKWQLNTNSTLEFKEDGKLLLTGPAGTTELEYSVNPQQFSVKQGNQEHFFEAFETEGYKAYYIAFGSQDRIDYAAQRVE